MNASTDTTRHSGEFFDGCAQMRRAGVQSGDGGGHRARGPRRAARP